MVKEIPLTKGRVALIDDEDFAKVSQFSWYAQTVSGTNYSDKAYAVRTVRERNEKGEIVRVRALGLHRFLLPGHSMVSHIDGDCLNNQRSNLRPSTNSTSQANRKNLSPLTSSQFRGVSWHRGCRKWKSSIRVNQQDFYLGLFQDEEEAARAYNEAALIHFGELASLNEIGE